MKVALLIFLTLGFLLPAASFACNGEDSVLTEQIPELKGFTTSLGRTSYYSSVGNYATGDYDFWLGFGYHLTPRLLLGIRIYSGREYATADKVFPFSGRFDLGGGSVNLLWRIPLSAKLQPFVEAGFQLSTILLNDGGAGGPNGGSSGYNGRAIQLSLGTEYFLTGMFSLHGELLFRHRQYVDVIVAGDNLGNKSTFTDNGYGVGAGCNIYFNFLP